MGKGKERVKLRKERNTARINKEDLRMKESRPEG